MNRLPGLPVMTLSEYVEFEKGNGCRIRLHEGRYWRMAAPTFWKALLPYSPIDPPASVPGAFRLGGYQFPVRDPREANSSMNYLVFEKPAEYQVDRLERKFRQDILRARKSLRLAMVDSLDAFIASAFPVYRSFSERASYRFRGDRRNLNSFSDWSRNVYASGKLKVLGAYRDDRLCGVMIVANVEGVIRMITTFSHSDALKLGVNEYLFHSVRDIARTVDGVRFIYAGMEADRPGVNEYKINRGATLVRKPAKLVLSPILGTGLKIFFRQRYSRLFGNSRI